MYYGIYKDIRNCAWQCLAEHEIDSLPVDILKIAHNSNIRIIRNSLMHDLLPHEKAKVYYDSYEWIIVYDDTTSVETCRFAIAHELGHIFLGHDLKHVKYANVREFVKKPKSEQQADAFALRLLSPACVLHALDLTTAEEIAAACKIPLEMAKLRADRMRELNKRNKFFTNPLEKEVYQKFENYLLYEINRKDSDDV